MFPVELSVLDWDLIADELEKPIIDVSESSDALSDTSSESELDLVSSDDDDLIDIKLDRFLVPTEFNLDEEHE